MARARSHGTQGRNTQVAGSLRKKAAILEVQNANPFRVNAYGQESTALMIDASGFWVCCAAPE
jgi:DNA polymerase/3'-5' exonuclease PolX